MLTAMPNGCIKRAIRTTGAILHTAELNREMSCWPCMPHGACIQRDRISTPSLERPLRVMAIGPMMACQGCNSQRRRRLQARSDGTSAKLLEE